MENNYINMYGSMSHAWRRHRQKMAEQHKPWVTYATFRHRVKNLNWTLEKAVNTPAFVSKRDKDRRMKVKWHMMLYRVRRFFIRLFK